MTANGAPGSESFYRDLPDFSDFDRFGELENYAPVPDDWTVMVSDVRGSTKAIAEGRYKQVNMAGAATIAAVMNAADGAPLPFTFGGDGAAILAPPSAADPARAALRRLQAHSGAALGLSLRAAAIPVARIRAEGADLRVRKFRLGEGNHLAMFAGGGLVRADEIMKAEAEGDPDILQPDPEAGKPDLEGLSCRWEPVRPDRGRIISLMVAAADPAEEQAVLRDTVRGLNRILTGGLRRFAPVRREWLRLRWPPEGLGMEARMARAGRLRGGAWAAFTSFNQFLCERLRIRIADYDGRSYADELVEFTDFRKYDGVFRTVLNVTEAQARAIEAYLEGEYRRGRVIHGAHLGDEALITCLVFDLALSQHVHFVDGAGGGLAEAARAFKERARALRRDGESG